MNIQTVSRASSTGELNRPHCPRCGLIVFMAERAALSPDGDIRHTWSCDDCGHEFVTTIRMRGDEPGRTVTRWCGQGCN
jgi:ribosomal protein S27AE